MNPILADFNKFVVDISKEAIKESFENELINPKEILSIMDDISLDWIDDANKVDFSFCADNYNQSSIIFKSDFSGKCKFLPSVNRISDMENIISNINSGKVHYLLEISTPIERPKSGKEFWNVIDSIINRIKMEYDVKYIKYFDHGFYRNIHDDGTKKDIRCLTSGHVLFDMNHSKLKIELSKIWKVTLFLDIK